mgnify:CR=1 FL=1
MIVLDASAAVDLLHATPNAAFVREWFPERERSFVAPDILAFEVASATRRAVLRGLCTPERGGEAIEEFLRLPKHLYPTQGALRSAWALRDDVPVADALYLVVAGALGGTLVTTDERLASVARAGGIPVSSPASG